MVNNTSNDDFLIKTNFFHVRAKEVKPPKEIFTYKNLKVFYPCKPDDVDTMYKLFNEEFYHFLIPKLKRINFTSQEFDAFNLLCRVNDEQDILQLCQNIGLRKERFYRELIDGERYANCGFLHVIYMLYNIKKYNYNIVAIDSPEIGLRPSIIDNLLFAIMSMVEQLIIFTFNQNIWNRFCKNSTT